ncbi:MMPL family transporter [Desulfonatronum thiodismutans]|uniref:MMPL family transporter n=1 Tax=Desulfonatronum thiodismutans TaxID=159290 RepID=UPI0004ABE3B0|nr:MMPL family transporter [Desulfonatronum thiodismutans]
MARTPATVRLFTVLLSHKSIVLLLLAGCLFVGLFFLRQATLTEDIEAMLPDDGSGLAEDVRLLGHAPLLSKVLVILEPAPGRSGLVDLEKLERAAQDIRTAAGPPWFIGPDHAREQLDVLDKADQFLSLLPALSTPSDLKRIEALIQPESVHHALEEARETLLGLQGLGMKGLISSDPLGLRNLIWEKLSSLDILGDGFAMSNPDEGIFLNPEQPGALIILDTPVAMTDARGSRDMLAALDAVLAVTLADASSGSFSDNLSSPIRAFVISGHAYTAANAQAIQRDLAVVLPVSALGILALFVLFLRSWRAVFAYATPLVAMLAGVAAVAATGNPLSGITLGFGAVLMGLAVDYGLHVWYGLRRGADPAQTLALLAKPILFCWLTTAGVFSLLLFSSLPGQRQLALFTVSGLSAAMLLSLTVLPVLLLRRDKRHQSTPERPLAHLASWPTRRGPAISAFVALLVAAVLCWPSIHFDGRLQALSMVPEELAQAERVVTESWSGIRNLAMLVAQGDTLDNALQTAHAQHAFLEKAAPGTPVVSLAPLLPPGSVQDYSIQRWTDFWAQRKTELQEIMARESAELGFAPQAFAPFFDFLQTEPRRVNGDLLLDLGMGDLIDMLVVRDHGRTAILTLIPDEPALHALLPSETRLVSQTLLGQHIAAALHRDMTRFLLAAGVFVVLMTAILFRDPRRMLQALTPALAGLSALIVVVTLLNIPFNLYSVAATFLVLGLGVDYGIFMAMRHDTQRNSLGTDLGTGLDTALDTEWAVLVSGLTTLLGFGALVLADHPALHSIGLTVLIGIAAAIPAALFVVPSLEPPPSTNMKNTTPDHKLRMKHDEL